jgi:hypothetical protein
MKVVIRTYPANKSIFCVSGKSQLSFLNLATHPTYTKHIENIWRLNTILAQAT